MSVQKVELPVAFQDLFRPARYKILYGGRGGGKSHAAARALVLRARQEKTRVLCTREIQRSIRESVHKLLADEIERLGFSSFFRVTDRSIHGENGSEFIFEGLLRNIDSIKSLEGVNVCWVEEGAYVSESSWKTLIPTIREPGSEIWVTFNPRLKTDACYQRFVVHPPPEAIVRKVSWRDNPWFPDELRQEMEHLKETDFDEYMHVWEGELREFADGAVYGAELKRARREGRICKIPIETTIPVNTFWDLGRNDSTAIWFHQRVGAENRFIDCYEHSFVGLDHYILQLDDWRRKHGVVYGEHFLPHDVEVTELTTNKSRLEVLEKGGVKPIVVVPRVRHINEGIEMTRRSMGGCWFDEERCEAGIEALSNYSYSFDETHSVYRLQPQHDWSSHLSDAFRQFGQGYNKSAGWAGALRSEREIPPWTSDRRREKIKSRFKQTADWRI